MIQNLGDKPINPYGQKWEITDLSGMKKFCFKGVIEKGMTLREYAAVHAMQGLLATGTDVSESTIAEWAIYQANELLNKLEKANAMDDSE